MDEALFLHLFLKAVRVSSCSVLVLIFFFFTSINHKLHAGSTDGAVTQARRFLFTPFITAHLHFKALKCNSEKILKMFVFGKKHKLKLMTDNISKYGRYRKTWKTRAQ